MNVKSAAILACIRSQQIKKGQYDDMRMWQTNAVNAQTPKPTPVGGSLYNEGATNSILARRFGSNLPTNKLRLMTGTAGSMNPKSQWQPQPSTVGQTLGGAWDAVKGKPMLGTPPAPMPGPSSAVAAAPGAQPAAKPGAPSTPTPVKTPAAPAPAANSSQFSGSAQRYMQSRGLRANTGIFMGGQEVGRNTQTGGLNMPAAPKPPMPTATAAKPPMPTATAAKPVPTIKPMNIPAAPKPPMPTATAAKPVPAIKPMKTAAVKRAWGYKPVGPTLDTNKPSKDEFDRRKDRVRRIIGTIMGLGYGAFAGSMIGKEFLGKPLVPSALAGAGVGGLAGLGVGTAMGHLKRYTGENDHQNHPPVQIIIPSSNPEAAKARIEEAMQNKQASVLASVRRMIKKAQVAMPKPPPPMATNATTGAISIDPNWAKKQLQQKGQQQMESNRQAHLAYANKPLPRGY